MKLSILTLVLFLAVGQKDCRKNQTGLIDDLGTLGGDSSFALGINSSGSVVGNSFKTPGPNEGRLHAFRYVDGVGMVDVGALPSADLSEGQGISGGGSVVGGSFVTNASGVETNAFFASSTLNLFDIGRVDRYSYAWDINDRGEVTGEADNDLIQTHAFVWTRPTGMRDLGTLGGSRSVGRSINEAGQVAGESATLNDSTTHAFRFTPGQPMRDLGTLGGRKSSGYGINDYGEVVGESDFRFVNNPTAFAFPGGGLTGTHAFFWSDGPGMKDLGHLGGGYSIAHALNNDAEVVGYSTIAGGARRAFRWTRHGGMKDLNTLLPPNSGWILTEAWDINDRSQIAGNGIHNGKHRAFRMNLPRTTVLDANFDGNTFNAPAARVGSLYFEPPNGVNVVETPHPDIQRSTWCRIGFPASGPNNSLKGEFSRFDGAGNYTITATMFIREGSDIVTLQFEPYGTGPVDRLHFLHIDFTPQGQVRIDDGPIFGTYPEGRVFKLRVNLAISDSAATARVMLSGTGATGTIEYNLPSQSMTFARRFGAIRFYVNLGHGQLFLDDILVTRRDL